MQSLAGNEQERAEGGVLLVQEPDGPAEGAAVEEWEVGVGGGLALFPVIADIIDGVERQVVGLARRLVGGEAAVRRSFDEVPQGDEPGVLRTRLTRSE